DNNLFVMIEEPDSFTIPSALPIETSIAEVTGRIGSRRLDFKLMLFESLVFSSSIELSTEGLYQNSAPDISQDIFASIKKDHIESKEAIRESEKFLTLNPSFHYIQTKNTLQGTH
ncbi:1961_t:CDS:2, partial [Funneliformis geosporum]